MLSQFGLIRCWTIRVLVFTIWDIVNGDNVVEVNEKDLNDHGFNINPSELDLLLPVVNPLKTSLRYTKTIMRPKQTNKAIPSGSKNNIHNLRFPDAFLKFAKSSPKHVNPSSNKTAKKNPKIILNRNNSKSTHQIQKESNSKQTDISTHYNSDIFKSKKFHQGEVYYNLHDLDEPVIIKKRKNQQGRVVEDKQEMLNNTLAFYGLRLDPKGETVILKGNEENKQQTEKRKKKKHETVDERGKETKLKSGKNLKKDSSKKDHTQDVIKSVWNVFKNASQKWK